MDDLLNTAPCGFLSLADDGTVVAVNATLLDMLGYARDELDGRHVDSILTTASRIFYQTHFFPLLRVEGKAEEIYLTLQARDRSSVPVLANAWRREREGRMVSDCAFISMWQRQKYEDEILSAKRAAEEASQAKAKFLSMMSHELRTPLNAISGFADILSMGIHGPVTEEQVDDLRRIRNASQYLLALINDILNLSRLEAGRVDVRIGKVGVEEALTRAEAMVAMRITEARLEYVREPCDPELRVQADADRLQQVLLNLLTNAVKFTPEGGRVSVACETQGARVLIHVSDTGRGIPAEKLGRIFDPFVQVDRHRNEASQQGVGLGLSISRELARAMGGDLRVDSKEGHGSVFTIVLARA